MRALDYKGLETFAEKASLAVVLEDHPEVRILWEKRDKLDGPVEINGVNPVLHVLSEAIVETQIQQNNPQAAKTAFNRLCEQGFTPHAARGNIAAVLLANIFALFKEGSDFNTDTYTRQLSFLNAGFGKVGRNEKCPCGSGKKYKKCCMSVADEVKVAPDVGNLHLGANFYAPLEYLQTLPPEATLIQVENRAHIAEFLEAADDVEGALACLRENVAAAEKEHPELLLNALQDLQLLCINNAELACEGIEVSERLMSLVPDGEEWPYRCDKAELQAAAGKFEEAEREFEALFTEFPDHEFVRYRYALFLYKYDRYKEAEDVLRALLARKDQLDVEVCYAAEELLESIQK